MKHKQQIVIKQWIPILEEYERIKTKQVPRVFRNTIKDKEVQLHTYEQLQMPFGEGSRGKSRGTRVAPLAKFFY